MANTVQNTAVPAPYISTVASGVASFVSGKKSGNAENSAESSFSFMNFVLARVTALQNDKEKLTEITEPTSTVTNGTSLLSSDSNSLAAIAKLLSPFDGDGTTAPQSLETIPEDAKAALKNLSAAILKMADKGLITLTGEQSESLKSLAGITLQSETPILSSDEISTAIDSIISDNKDNVVADENGNKNIVINIGEDKIVIPESLIKFTGEETEEGKNISENAVENSNALSHVVAQLEKIAKKLSSDSTTEDSADTEISETAADIEVEENPAALASMLNNIEPADSSDDTVEGQVSEETDTVTVDEDTVIAALVTAITPDTKSEKKVSVELSSGSAPVSPDADSPKDSTAKSDKMSDENAEASADITTGKSDSTNTKSEGKVTSAFAQLINSSSEKSADSETTSMTSSADEIIAEDTSLLKNADALIRSDLKESVMRTSSAAQNSPAQQIAIHLHKSIGNGDSKFTLKLEPEELGEVTIRLSMSKDGKAKAAVMAEKGETLSLLMKDSVQLQKALNEAGLNASAEDLTFQLRDHNNQAFGQQNNNNAGNSNTGKTTGTGNSSEEFGIISTGTEEIIGEHRINYRV